MIRKKAFSNFFMLIQIFFIKNMNKAKDFPSTNFRHMINDQDKWIISADKDSCVVLLRGIDCIHRLEAMINEVIEFGTYVECQHTAISDLEQFQHSLRQNSKNYEKQDKLRPVANFPAKLFATT